MFFDDWSFFDSDGSNTPNQQMFVRNFPNTWNWWVLKKNQIHGQHWCEAHLEPVTMRRIQFPLRWPAKRNDQKEISSEFIYPTKYDPKFWWSMRKLKQNNFLWVMMHETKRA